MNSRNPTLIYIVDSAQNLFSFPSMHLWKALNDFEEMYVLSLLEFFILTSMDVSLGFLSDNFI